MGHQQSIQIRESIMNRTSFAVIAFIIILFLLFLGRWISTTYTTGF